MSNRPRLIAIAAAIGVGILALALIPSGREINLAETPAKSSLAAPNPDLLRRLDAEVAPVPQSVDAAPVRVAVITPAPAAPAPVSDLPSVRDPNISPGTIGGLAVNMRSGPSTSAETITVLEPGESIQVGEASGGWINVTRADGTAGWVYSSYLAGNSPPADDLEPARIAAVAQPRALIQGNESDLEDRTAHIASRLPAYGRPSNGAKSVFTLEPGDQVYIAEVRGTWLRVETEDGMTAWIRR